MLSKVSNNQVRKAPLAVALTLAAAAAAAVIAGSAAVSAQTSSSATASGANAQMAALAMSPRPLTIRGTLAKPARAVRVIRLYNVPAEQKNFGQR